MSREHNIRILNIASRDKASDELKKVGVDPDGVNIMTGKMRHYNIKIENLDLRQANILKQEMLSLGADAAVHKQVVSNKIDRTDSIIMATRKQLLRAIKKLKIQPFGLKKIAEDISELLNIDTFKFPEMALGGKTFDFNENIYIMGILNVTPDSFSDGGTYLKENYALAHAEQMLKDGADIIDVGGESTRPGSKPVPLDEEIKRVVPIIKGIKKSMDVPVSIDTYKADVARAALDAGADAINDISAMRFDAGMKKLAAEACVPVMLMHIKGTPRDMQAAPEYDCVITEINDYLSQAIDEAVAAGIDEHRIIIDPGIGFGKAHEHNVTIIKRLSEFKALRKPILMGVSRKSLIGNLTGKDIANRLCGTLAANVVSALNGANILRVHDVKETVDAAKVAKAFT